MNFQQKNRPVIGIVGGIGSGKTEIAAKFAELGCAVIDCDKLGHALLKENSVKQEIQQQWGQAVFSLTGEVDRKALAAIVFADRAELDKLDKILHPRIRELIEQGIESASAQAPAVVIDAAVLFEAGWDDLCTDTIFVDAPAEERFERIHNSRLWTREEFLSREKLQIPLDIKAGRCCHILSNSFSISRLHEKCSQLLLQITHK